MELESEEAARTINGAILASKYIFACIFNSEDLNEYCLCREIYININPTI